jgi:hypothetical protein
LLTSRILSKKELVIPWFTTWNIEINQFWLWSKTVRASQFYTFDFIYLHNEACNLDGRKYIKSGLSS